MAHPSQFLTGRWWTVSGVLPNIKTANWLDLTPLQASFGMEGLKTIGYEIAEQFSWTLPDVIVSPYRDGLLLSALWKAFGELESLGWIVGKRPRMVGVQMEREQAPAGEGHTTKLLRESGGKIVAVSQQESLDGALTLFARLGISGSPEGGACVTALRILTDRGFLSRGERVLLCNTASGLKNLEVLSVRFPRRGASEHDKLGGLITPR